MPRPRKRKAHGSRSLRGDTATAILRRMAAIAASRAELDAEQAALMKDLQRLLATQPAQPVPVEDPELEPISHLELRGSPAPKSHRDLVINRRHRLPLSPQEFLLLRAMSAAAPRGSYVKTAALLPVLRALLSSQTAKNDAWSTLDDACVYRLASRLRGKLRLIGFEHLLMRSACKGAGYLLNALIVELPPEAPAR